MTLLEIALLADGQKLSLRGSVDGIFDLIRSKSGFQLLPVTYDIALEVTYLKVLRDPADRVIVATARTHNLRLVTSDERICESGLIEVVD